MKFTDIKEMKFSIHNQGKFQFNYKIFDWFDEEIRKELAA